MLIDLFHAIKPQNDELELFGDNIGVSQISRCSKLDYTNIENGISPESSLLAGM